MNTPTYLAALLLAAACSGAEEPAIPAVHLLQDAGAAVFQDAGGAGDAPATPADAAAPAQEDIGASPAPDIVADASRDQPDSSPPPDPGPSQPDISVPVDAAPADPGPEPDAGSAPDAGSPPPPAGAVPLKINVTYYFNLGDSAGEGCCTEGGNKWAYYPMLVDNDDAKYPDYAGHDLPSTWPTLTTTKNWADSGDTSADLKKDQLPKFSKTYKAPVIVTIHIGGNDFNDHDIMDFLAKPQKIADDGKALEKNLDAILTFLEDPARFPAGSFVFVANIPSPTDGECSFTGKLEYNVKWCEKIRLFGCLAPGWVEQLESYNAHIASAVAKHENAHLADVHSAFLGHGLNADDPENPNYLGPGAAIYYNTDCVHPNAAGHHAIRQVFYEAMTGY